MRLAALLGWAEITAAARAAGEAGLDAVGFWDHYHSGQPDWAYVCGRSALGAIAAATTRVRTNLFPNRRGRQHHDPASAFPNRNDDLRLATVALAAAFAG